jgi:hypothetical protein
VEARRHASLGLTLYINTLVNVQCDLLTGAPPPPAATSHTGKPDSYVQAASLNAAPAEQPPTWNREIVAAVAGGTAFTLVSLIVAAALDPIGQLTETQKMTIQGCFSGAVASYVIEWTRTGNKPSTQFTAWHCVLGTLLENQHEERDFVEVLLGEPIEYAAASLFSASSRKSINEGGSGADPVTPINQTLQAVKDEAGRHDEL